MYHKFIRTDNSKPVIVTAIGKKEMESGMKKNQFKYLGPCDEMGVLDSSVVKDEGKKPVVTVTKSEKTDSKTSVEDILNSDITKEDPLAKGMEAKAQEEKNTMNTVPNPPSDDEPIMYGHN